MIKELCFLCLALLFCGCYDYVIGHTPAYDVQLKYLLDHGLLSYIVMVPLTPALLLRTLHWSPLSVHHRLNEMSLRIFL